MSIPPRPWRVEDRYYLDIEDAEGLSILTTELQPGGYDWSACFGNRATAEHIVRLVNAEAEVVAALEAAEVYLDELDRITVGGAKLASRVLDGVRAALAKLNG